MHKDLEVCAEYLCCIMFCDVVELNDEILAEPHFSGMTEFTKEIKSKTYNHDIIIFLNPNVSTIIITQYSHNLLS